MKRLGILAFLMIVVITGGVISSGLLNDSLNGLLIVQTNDPNSSPFVATPQQAMQIVVWGGFVLANVIGLALVLALVFWFINRGLAQTRGGRPGAAASTATAVTESEAASE